MLALRSACSFGLAAMLFAATPLTAQDAPPTEGELLRAQQNWKEALVAHDRALAAAADWLAPATRQAVEGGIAAALGLGKPDEALRRAETYIAQVRGHFEEAVGLRLLGGLYQKVPHEANFKNGKWRREGSSYGLSNSLLFETDRAAAIQAYERAREILARLATDPASDPGRDRPGRAALLRSERIGLNFDLIVALTLQDYFRGGDFRHWVEPSASPPALLDADESDDAGWEAHRRRDRPAVAGFRAGPGGAPQFLVPATAYAPGLADGAKARFLLEEIERLDDSAEREDAALALLRQAELAVKQYESRTDEWMREAKDLAVRRGHPLPAFPAPSALSDEEFLLPVEGVLRVVRLPAGENPVALAALVVARYPQSRSVFEARRLVAKFHANRRQYVRALAEFRALQAESGFRGTDLQREIGEILQPQVALEAAGTHYPGDKPRLTFSCRQAGAVRFQAWPFDLHRFVRERLTKPRDEHDFFSWSDYDFFERQQWREYIGSRAAEWTEAVPSSAELASHEGQTRAPLIRPGTWLIEASVEGGKEVSRTLLHVTDLALVEKNVADGRLIWVVDARSGHPAAGVELEVFERLESGKEKKWIPAKYRSPENGLVLHRTRRGKIGSSSMATLAGAGARFAFTYPNSFSGGSVGTEQEETVYHAQTDRPIYRPGQTVKYRIWARERKAGRYLPPRAGLEFRYRLDPSDERNGKEESVATDEAGGHSGEFVLPAEAKLGIWSLTVWQRETIFFQVEEYKRPEFEVTVQPAQVLGRLGQKLRASIGARYYFGAPVTDATVVVRIFREAYRPEETSGPFDWLYGAGYGDCAYDYPWLGVLGAPFRWDVRPERELVREERTTLGADGTCAVEIDTAAAQAQLGDRDHRYLIEAEVRDASRRTIEGRGSILATREEFSIRVEVDRGWYRGGDTASIVVRTATAANVPVATQGELVVLRYRYSGPLQETVQEEIVHRLPAATDAQGRFALDFVLPGEGQYALRYVTHDSARRELRGQAVFWVHGPKFEGSAYRFQDLEIITDKRDYRVGEKARVLIQAAASSHVLFNALASSANGARGAWRVIPLVGRTTVIEIPIEPRHVPNFYVQAVLVRDGRIQDSARNIAVPPVRARLDLSVQVDRSTYRPGEKGRLLVTARDEAGQPARGHLTLSVFDESLTYFTRELPTPLIIFRSRDEMDHPLPPPGPLASFHGQRAWSPERYDVRGSSPRGFGAQGFLREPGSRAGLSGDLIWSLEGVGLRLGGSLVERPGVPARELDDRADRRKAGDLGPIPLIELFQPARVVVTGSYIPSGPEPAPTIAFTAGAWTGPEPKVRTDFSETALWAPRLTFDAEGKAEAEVTFPESLTAWRIEAEALSLATEAGHGRARVTTDRPFLVQLQAPRFFVERDEVVLSANVHSTLAEAQPVRAELLVPAALFAAPEGQPAPDGQLRLTAEATVAARGQQRFDWRLKVRQAGLAHIAVKAIAPQESDAMRLAFPVVVHGIEQQIALSGSFLSAQNGERTLTFELPADIDTSRTELEVTLSPGLAPVLVDALPYLLEYPYGCTEQTVSRFYAASVTAGVLKKFGLELDVLAEQRGWRSAEESGERAGPVSSPRKLEKWVRAGGARLRQLQRSDGGWGWWQHGEASLELTAYVVDALLAAEAAGARLQPELTRRGFDYLQARLEWEFHQPERRRNLPGSDEQAFLAYVLSQQPRPPGFLRGWLDTLFQERARLNLYGKALLALALQRSGRTEQAALALRNVLQFVERDEAAELAWVAIPGATRRSWWHSQIETNACTLRALLAIEPKSDLTPRLAKWLLGQRRGGHYWRNTRDTALVVRALSEYCTAAGEVAPDLRVSVRFDGQAPREVRITRENQFAPDHRVVIPASQLPPGRRTVTLGKQGAGALYYSARLRYFSREEDVRGAGHGLAIRREYYKLESAPRATAAAAAAPGATRDELRAAHKRTRLASGETVASGDLIEVVLNVTAKESYEYLAFEDPKPAGCESVALVSGHTWANGWISNVELRDRQVVFFVPFLEQGEHLIRYRLRAEVPGHFHALPTTGFAMYEPEIRATSDEMRVKVE